MEKISGWLKRWFVPHEKNEHRPHFLRHESTLVCLLIVIIIELGFLAQVFVVFDKTNFLAAVLPGTLTALANEERADNGFASLKTSEILTRAAQLKANDMATRGYFAHVSPDGKTPWYWLDQVGYRYSMAGENLAINFSQSEDVSRAWMNSPSHRANILKDNYTEIGIAVATGTYQGRKTVFVAQFFGTPLNLPVTQTPQIAQVSQASISTQTEISNEEVLGEANAPKTESVTEVKPNNNTKASSATQSRIRTLLGKLFTSPLKYSNYIFAIVAGVLILVLILAIFIKSEIQHPAMLARGVALVSVIIFLFYLNMSIVHTETSVPKDSLSASIVIAL